MSAFQDPAYTMAAISATVALFRALVKKGVLSRDEAVRAILDEAVTRAIQAEAQVQAQDQAGRTTNEVNRQAAEILKFIGEKL
jgi:polyhydroxyalkanoate synthesis regulator phasin